MEPFGFFSLDALRAGWYLIWRQFARVIPVILGAALVGYLLISMGMRPLGTVLIVIGVFVGGVWAAVLVPRLASQWSQEYYGYPLTGGFRLWWSLVWRIWVASFVAAIVLTPPQMVATSLTASFKGSALGGLGGLLTVLLGLANIAVTLLSTGWAMSRVALAQSGDYFARLPTAPLSPLGPLVSEPTLEPAMAAASAPIEPVDEPQPAVARAPIPERAAPIAAPSLAAPRAPAAVASASNEGKRQCPKCSLYETELGTVIGWYCRICGWRETRR
jgi:hypothetical protein